MAALAYVTVPLLLGPQDFEQLSPLAPEHINLIGPYRMVVAGPLRRRVPRAQPGRGARRVTRAGLHRFPVAFLLGPQMAAWVQRERQWPGAPVLPKPVRVVRVHPARPRRRRGRAQRPSASGARLADAGRAARPVHWSRRRPTGGRRRWRAALAPALARLLCDQSGRTALGAGITEPPRQLGLRRALSDPGGCGSARCLRARSAQRRSRRGSTRRARL